MLRTLWPFLWRYGCGILLLGLLPSCSGKSQPAASRPPAPGSYVQHGTASWYGEPFHGRRTANGEIYDMFAISAAHVTAPLGIHAIVTNLDTERSIRVRINDRGPYVGDRILDLSYGAARQLGMVQAGLARVRIEFLLETVPTPTFIVQAGAYADQDKAAHVQQVLAPQYPQVWVAEARAGPVTFYRVRLGTFSSRADAEQAARRVAAQGYAASVMPFTPSPEPTRRMDSKF